MCKSKLGIFVSWLPLISIAVLGSRCSAKRFLLCRFTGHVFLGSHQERDFKSLDVTHRNPSGNKSISTWNNTWPQRESQKNYKGQRKVVRDGNEKEGSRKAVTCGWRDESVVKRTTSSGGHRHSSQHPQQSVCSPPEHPASSLAFTGTANTWYTDMHTGKALLGIKF